MLIPRPFATFLAWFAAGLGVASSDVAAPATAPSSPSPEHLAHGYRYHHDEFREIPWSIHVFEFDRSRTDLAFANSLANGESIGLATVSDQMKALAVGHSTVPIAAVNGDFYNSEHGYPGDPRDLQICDGELLSAPKGHACFWIDPSGQPHSTNVTSRFEIRWPDRTTTPFGLNEARDGDAAVVYSSANGTSTRTSGGVEIVLEEVPGQNWLPLHPGEEIQARVRETRTSGDTPITRGQLVLSIGPTLAPRVPRIVAGGIVKISTATFPELRGVRMAIGGGPTLVQDSKPMTWANNTARHPRTAIGWNHDRYFLVEVDGRQAGISAGMSFPELATYMRKLGCDEAMNLDGGGSATLWVCGQVMNSPSEGHERPGANALVVVQHKAEPTTKVP